MYATCTLPHPAPSHTLFLEVSLETNTCLVLTLVSVCQGIVHSHSQDWERGLTPAVEERSLAPRTKREKGLTISTAREVLLLTLQEVSLLAQQKVFALQEVVLIALQEIVLIALQEVMVIALWEVSFLALQEIIFLELQEVMLVALWARPCS